MTFSFLDNSLGKTIQIERGGPDKLKGTLLGVKKDHLIVYGENGIVYVNTHHIKTISEPILTEVATSDEQTPDEATPELTVVDACDLYDLMGQLQYKLVKINQNGPNALEGVILNVHEDAITIVHQMKDYVHYPMYHIKTITWMMNVQKQDEKKNDGNKEEEKK